MSARIILVTLFSAVLLSSCSSPPDDRQGQCHPCTVSIKVGPLIKEALTLAQAKNYKAALAKLDEAEAVKAYADDETVINQVRNYIDVVSSPPQTPNITPQFPQP